MLEIVNKEVSTYNQFSFSDNSWCAIDAPDENEITGFWEFQSDINDETTYCSGSFLLDNPTSERIVIDYDGVFELPQQVLIALNNLNFITSKL